MKKPIIGMLANVAIDENGIFPSMSRSVVSYDYIESVVAAGGIPLIMPIVEEEAGIYQQLAQVDGLLLTGGFDIDPLQYGEEPRPVLGEIFPQLDKYQMQAARIAAKLEKPILGICRGLQVLNVAFGGTLYQDVTSATSDCLKHFQKGQRQLATHTVELTAESTLAQIFNKTTIGTNSYHHQCVKMPAPGFVVNAKAEDGVIEGLEKMDRSFILGVQWHPEMMAPYSDEMKKIFATFINVAKAQ